MRYRAVDVRIWGDRKFRSLSPLQSSGQALFLYLLTNPNTTSIPGLFRAGAAAMAEELDWPIKGFREALTELIEQDLIKVDLNARVIFIPNVIKYNKPQSPNVVKSWASHWDEIPECDLKNIAYMMLKTAIEAMGKAFLEAFDEAIGKALRKTISNQEQEQEQETNIIEVGKSSLSETTTIASTVFSRNIQDINDKEVHQIFEHWKQIMLHPNAKFDSKRQKVIKAALKLGFSVDELKQAVEGCAKTPFFMGKNEDRQLYNSLSVILKNADQIERFIKNATADENMFQVNSLFVGAI